jgi:tetratricopeptide (TPR) repeat protein
LRAHFFPVSLSVLYPHARVFPAPLHLAAALALLGTASAAALRGWRRRPYFFVGWFWFLGVLLPMVGVVQVFIAAIANRYTYLSQIGLAICAVWGAAELVIRFAVPRRAVAVLAAAILAVLIVLDIRQVATWQDDVTLWTHAVAATARNDYAWNNLGNAYAVRGDYARTRECYRKALELNPTEAMYHLNYGRVMEQAGDTTTALAHYQAAVTAKPEDVQARIRTGEALLTLKRADEALAQFDAALARDARNARIYADRGAAWALKGALERAAADDMQALALDPNCIRAHYDLGLLAAGRQDFKSAVESFSTAARLQPAAAEPRVQLGQVYAIMGDKTRAAENFRVAHDLARRAGNPALEQKAANFLQKL